MSDVISARDANQNFSRILNAVTKGKEFVVTRNGIAIARIVPERGADGRRKLTEEQERLLARSRYRLLSGAAVTEGRLNRNETYDEVLGVTPERA
jgi:prevent-host-death family protein